MAPFVLKHLKVQRGINRSNYTLETVRELRDFTGIHLEEFTKRLMEAFIWLEQERFLAPRPGRPGEWRFITRRGEKVLQNEDFSAYNMESLLDLKSLHPILSRKVKPLFIRGDYDTAIFQAFKSVEVQVRNKGGYSHADFGVSLMRKAFHTETGPLTDMQLENAEKQAMSDLFAGAIGLFKNPVSHRFIDTFSPEDTADILRFANYLLKYLEGDSNV